MRPITLTWTTNASGAATVIGESVYGEVEAVDYLPGTTDTGATFTLTDEGAMSHQILQKATAGTTNTRYYPRDLVNAALDGAALTGTSGGDRVCPLVAGNLKVVIASGGNAKTGSIVVHVGD